VQPGYRTHNRSTGTHRRTNHHASAQLRDAFAGGATPPEPAAYSDARRAAEAAFSAPPAGPTEPAALNHQAQITVKRARLPGSAEAVVAGTSTFEAGLDPAASSKTPRVFRVDMAPVAVGTAPALGSAPEQQAQPSTTLSPHLNTGARRRPSHTRPGPVVHTVHMVHTVRTLDAAHARPAPPHTAMPPAATLQTVLAQMAEVTSIFDAIKKAQSLAFVDAGFDQAWQKLLRQAQALGKRMR
jgi:hypothetical protein